MSEATRYGRVFVVGTGPGPAEWMTPETSEVLRRATDLVGYAPYVARCPEQSGQRRHGSDNRVELDRARHALELAMEGAIVAVVSGGDPGVFAMAAAVMEAIDTGPTAWRSLEVTVLPGVSAMQAASARCGAPLGADFCALNLSDNLKPWAVVERRLTAVAEADLVIALYNPASKARPQQIFAAIDLLRRVKPLETVVIFARAVGRPDECITISTLGACDPSLVDMATCVIVGNSATRCIDRPGERPPWVYSPRSVSE